MMQAGLQSAVRTHLADGHGHGAPPGPGDGAGHRGLRPVAVQRQAPKLREPCVDGQDIHPHGTNFTEPH